MRAVGIKALKDRLSEFVRLAAGGETILVTDRERVVAELIPPGPGRATLAADAALAEAVRRGWIAPPMRTDLPLPPRAPVATLAEVLHELATDRQGR